MNASSSTDSDGTIEKYEWTFGDGARLYQAAATATHIYKTGTFTVQLVVRDNGGASATATPCGSRAASTAPAARSTTSGP